MKKEKVIICRDINRKKYRVAANKLTFRPSVYAVIVEKGKVLLSKQWDGYDFPGGGIEINETTEEALKREVWEETGVKIKVVDIIYLADDFHKMHRNGQYVHSILVYYLCRKIGGKISIDNIADNEKSYIAMPEWLDLGMAKKVKFYNSIDNIKLIKKALKLCRKYYA